jgi:hypothetical protein
LRFFAPVLADSSRFIDAESGQAAQRGNDSTQATVYGGNVYPLHPVHADTVRAASSARAPAVASGSSSSSGHAE